VRRKKQVNKYPTAFRKMAGAAEELQECDGASGRTGESSNPAVQVAGPDGAGGGRARTAANSRERELRKEIRELKRVLGEKALEVDFFKSALQKVEARRQSNSGSGAKASTTESGS